MAKFASNSLLLLLSYGLRDPNNFKLIYFLLTFYFGDLTQEQLNNYGNR